MRTNFFLPEFVSFGNDHEKLFCFCVLVNTSNFPTLVKSQQSMNGLFNIHGAIFSRRLQKLNSTVFVEEPIKSTPPQ